MNTHATTPARTTDTQTRRLLVRMNATLFYCVGAAVLLESARTASSGARACAAVDGELAEARRESAQSLRDYASSVWPEFAWERACAAMRHCGAETDASTRAACAQHVALFYRTLARVADDSLLRDRLAAMAAVEERVSRCCGEKAAVRGLARLRRIGACRAYARRCHDHLVRRAFEALRQHWADVPPFPPSTYEQCLARARALFAPHLALGWIERLALGVWLRPAKTRRSGTVSARRVTNGALGANEAVLRAACALPPAAWLR